MLREKDPDTRCVHLGHDVLQLAAGLVGAVVVAESVQHLLVLELVLVGDWENKSIECEEEGGRQNNSELFLVAFWSHQKKLSSTPADRVSSPLSHYVFQRLLSEAVPTHN